MVNRRTNLITSRIGYFGTWNSRWVGENTTYADLVYQDFKVVSFLNGLFRKLYIPTGKFNITRHSFRVILIESDLYFIRPFWLLYSHIDRVFEHSSVYYIGRLLFNVPFLLERTHGFTLQKRTFLQHSIVPFIDKRRLERSERAIGHIRRPTACRVIRSAGVRCALHLKRKKIFSKKCFRASRILRILIRSIRIARERGYMRAIGKLSISLNRHVYMKLAQFIFTKVNRTMLDIRFPIGIGAYKWSIRNIKKIFSFYVYVIRLFFFDIGFYSIAKFVKRMLCARQLLHSARQLHLALRVASMRVHIFLFGVKRIYVCSKGYIRRLLAAFKEKLSLKFLAHKNVRIALLKFKKVFKSLWFLWKFLRNIRRTYVASLVQHKVRNSLSRVALFVNLVSAIKYSTSVCSVSSSYLSYSLLYSGVSVYIRCLITWLSVSSVSVLFGRIFSTYRPIAYSLRRLLCYLLRAHWKYHITLSYYAYLHFRNLFVRSNRQVLLGSSSYPLKLQISYLLHKFKIFSDVVRCASPDAALSVLGYLFNLNMASIKSKFVSRLMSVRAYYTNLRVIQSIKSWARLFRKPRIGRYLFGIKRFNFPGMSVLKSARFARARVGNLMYLSILHGRKRGNIFLLKGKMRKRFVRGLWMSYRLLHSFISRMWLRLSVDKLIQNIELTLSRYFNATILFFPRIYGVVPATKYWAHRGLVRNFYSKVKRIRRKRSVVLRLGKADVIKRGITNRGLIRRRVKRKFSYVVPHTGRKIRKFMRSSVSIKSRVPALRRMNNSRARRSRLAARLHCITQRRSRLYRCKWLRRAVFKRRKFNSIRTGTKKRTSFSYGTAAHRVCMPCNRKLRVTRRRVTVNVRNTSMFRGIRPHLNFSTSVRPYGNNRHVRAVRSRGSFNTTRIRRAFRRRRASRYGLVTSSRFPPIKDAKLVCDYIVYHLNRRVRVYRVFSNLKYWQTLEHRVTNTLKYSSWIESWIITKKYPLAGIRVLCAGSPKKGGRKRRNNYHLWVRNQRLTRTMPLQEIETEVDYFSSSTHVLTGTVGVKVWLCFSTISYKYRSRNEVYYI